MALVISELAFVSVLPVVNAAVCVVGAVCVIKVPSVSLLLVVALVAEAELRALFLNCQDRMIFKSTLEDMCHLQPKIPVHCNIANSVGIANNTTKRQISQVMEMRYFWTCERIHKMSIPLSGTPG